MYDQFIEKAIFTACVAEPRDFTEAEKQYILNCASEGSDRNSNFRDNLLFWFESRLSNDCWTEANIAFIKALSKTPNKGRTECNKLATFQHVSLDSQQLATILAALGHWQQSTRTVDRFAFPHFNFIDPLGDAEIDVLCEKINCPTTLLTDNATSSNCQTIDGDWKLFECSVEDPFEGKHVEQLSLIEICNRHQDLSPFLRLLKQSESLNIALESDESCVINIKSLWNHYH